MDTFYLGTHLPNWLEQTSHPLFISFNRLKTRRKPIKSNTTWILDSGAFTQLLLHGEHEMEPELYACHVHRLQKLIPSMTGAIIQDYMCEPMMLVKTGMSVQEHQKLTIDNYIRSYYAQHLVNWIPVLQGWHVQDYLNHLAMYKSEGIELSEFSLVGVGSICKRQSTKEAEYILQSLAYHGIRIHAFGFKVAGLPKVQNYIVSADSMAWSYEARRTLPIHGHNHLNCANCLEYALDWAEYVQFMCNIKKGSIDA